MHHRPAPYRPAALVLAILTAATLAAPARGTQESGPWGTAAPLLQPRSEIAVVEVDGRIYVIGGYPQGRIPSNVVQVYDTATESWQVGPRCRCPCITRWPRWRAAGST
ncbi:MAG: hypothetical protein U0531_03915 [Dehalococcoidia bacterium]